ncbi:MAG: imidazolonepropionase [Halobacteriota archaeon]
MTDALTVIHGATELVVGAGDDAPLEVVEDGAVAIEDGTVAEVGTSDEVTRRFPPSNADTAIDASGRVVLPGFVDSHTHAVYAGDRSDEFVARLSGVTYQELLAEGGGILRTVRAVREATEADLRDRLLDVLDVMLAHGATTVEVKSGYGLTVDAECKMLRAVHAADERHPIDLVATFLGAHAVPPESDRTAYVDEVVDEQLPAVVDEGLATYCDVFCDEGAFTREEAARILRIARELGLQLKLHAEEFARLGDSGLAAELGATSADHLLRATDEDARALADAGVIPTLLPGTAFTLGVDYADHERFLEAGAHPAIASDFNPNCHSPSMVMTVQLATHGMGMTPDAAVRAATVEAARAVDRPDRGHLRPGAVGDVAILDVPDRVHLAYTFGVNPVETVLKDGEVVHG